MQTDRNRHIKAPTKRWPYSLTPENVNFVIRTQRLLDTCRDLKVDVDTRESRIQNPPVVLAKLMQELCVEVECWEADAK